MANECEFLQLSASKRDRLLVFLKLISDDNRLRILQVLAAWPERCVCDIWKCLDLPQNLTSHHLGVLKEFGLVASHKEGTNVIYRLDRLILNEYIELLQLTLVTKKQ